MTATVPETVVVTDTSILINLVHTGHLSLLGRLSRFRFVVPDEVIAELTKEDQRLAVEVSISEGRLHRESIATVDELILFAELQRVLGAGESSCLAIAKERGWIVACDEKRVFLREAKKHLGKGRILNTPGIYLLSIQAGLITVEAADHAKAILEQNRFRMVFGSFADLISK